MIKEELVCIDYKGSRICGKRTIVVINGIASQTVEYKGRRKIDGKSFNTFQYVTMDAYAKLLLLALLKLGESKKTSSEKW